MLASLGGTRRAQLVAVLTLTLVAAAACSSSSGPAAQTEDAPSTSSSTTTTSTTPGSAPPPCTTEAATAAMTAPNRALGIVCIDGWASGPYSTGVIEAAYLARANGSSWRILAPSEFGRACARSNPLGIPADVLEQSPCGVS